MDLSAFYGTLCDLCLRCKKSFTLVRCFLFMAGDAGCPGLGTPLEAADPVPEWRRAERSSAERTPRPPGPTPIPAMPGACCCDTFCSSAASCLGSTPGERCPPTETWVNTDEYRTKIRYVHRYMHTCRHINKSLYIPALSRTWCSRACGCSGSDSILRSLFGSIQEIYDGILPSVT